MTQNPPEPKNIFEAATRIEKERLEKEKVLPKAPAGSQQEAMDEIFNRCRQIHQELSDSLDQALRRSNLTPSQVRGYVADPHHFSDRQWRALEEQKKKNAELLQDLQKKIGAPAPQKEGELPAKEPPKQDGGAATPPPPPPKPPKKPRVVTRRQWIGM